MNPLIPLLSVSLFLSSCAIQPKPAPAKPADAPQFTVSPAYETAPATGNRVEVNLSEQKARLLDAAGLVLVETQVSTGKPTHPSPRGTFPILEMLREKRSNRYGSYVDAQTGAVVVPKTWEHQGPRPIGTVYLGVSMPCWMRLTWAGVGMHIGDGVMGRPSSHGCIRVPSQVMPLIYDKCQVGTRVRIAE